MTPTAEKVKERSADTPPKGSRARADRNGASEEETKSIREAGSRIAAAMLEAADPHTGEHSDDVELVVDEICRRLRVNGDTREDILVAARLHDVGKVAVPREILEKKGPLDETEWQLIKEHTVTGERILRSVPELEPASRLVRHSHEHFDGSGYPDGLEGEDIPLGSRIILCADAFHAIRSDRPYRKGRPTRAAVQEMKRCAGTQFDPKVVDALTDSIEKSKRGRRRKLPPRLALLFAVLAIGGGGAYAAEKGWIPGPVPGLGPERSADEGAGAGEFESSSGDITATEGDAATVGSDGASGSAEDGGSNAGDEPGTAGAADRRGGEAGDRGRATAGPDSGAAEAGEGNGSGQDSGDGGESPGGSGPGGSADAASGGGGGSAGAGSGGGSSGGGSGGGAPSESPGNSGSAPGQTGETPGQSGSAPGQSGANPGQGGGGPPGQTGTAPGQAGTTPGQSGSAPGQSGSNPGLGGTPPGQSGGSPGNSGNAPGQNKP